MFLKKILKILLRTITLYNILSLSLILISLFLIILIFFQKNSDGFSETKNMFGPNYNSNDQVRMTYIVLFLFVAHILALNILSNKQYREIGIKDQIETIQKSKKAQPTPKEEGIKKENKDIEEVLEIVEEEEEEINKQRRLEEEEITEVKEEEVWEEEE